MSETWAWRKSSRSVGPDQDCVEVAPLAACIGIRDTKNRGNGHLLVPTRQWHAFVSSVKQETL